jgi:hypothetical protein
LKSAVIAAVIACEFDYLEIREIIADVWRVRYGSLQNLFHSLYHHRFQKKFELVHTKLVKMKIAK